jgi:hypothetical protein
LIEALQEAQFRLAISAKARVEAQGTFWNNYQ